MLSSVFSLTNIVSVAFMGYMMNNVYVLSRFWYPEQCSSAGNTRGQCLHPMKLEPDQPFTVQVFFTEKKPGRGHDRNEVLIYNNDQIDLSADLFEHSLNITLPKQAQNNGTFWTRVVLFPTGQPKYGTQAFGKMISHQVPIRYANLLGDEKAKEKVYDTMGHFRSKLEFNVMTQDVAFNRSAVPHELYKFISINPDNEHYKRMLYVSELNFRLDELKEIEPDSSEMELKIVYRPVGIGKMRLLLHMERSLMQFTTMGFQEKDIDDVKGLLVDTDMSILLCTFIVSAFHILFDCLAFKNDVEYWRKRETMTGMSIRTVGFQCFSTIVIFIHLMHEDTSLLVSLPMGASCFIETWKLWKAYRLRGQDGASETEEYDADIMNKLYKLLVPLCLAGAVYSLFYVPHKSWYGWVLQSLVNGVYAFGFLFMLPQLFINYKMKSVAHLPWRAFGYKAFNTFIDDVFAFIIKMPTSHRIACLRDDVVFFCYLYQRYLYPVDKSRVNEFGFSADDEDKQQAGDISSESDEEKDESVHEEITSAADKKTQ